MNRIGICLCGQDCSNSIVTDLNEVNINSRDWRITTYKRVSLKIIKSIHCDVSSRSFSLDQPFDIYAHVEYYDNYEVALKLILNSFIDAELEEVWWIWM